jgi:hypothetical protein
LHDVSLYMLELIENSIRAKAGVIAIAVEFDFELDRLLVSVEDDGEGIRVPAEVVLDPFYTTCTWKKVGLGLSLLKVVAESAGGGLQIGQSEALGGAAIDVWMGLSHLDRPPLGDIAATLSTMIMTNPTIDFRLQMTCAETSYSFRLAEFARQYGIDPDANIALASAAFQILRRDLEVWKRIELSSWQNMWHAREALPSSPWLEIMEQGADA